MLCNSMGAILNSLFRQGNDFFVSYICLIPYKQIWIQARRNARACAAHSATSPARLAESIHHRPQR